MYCNYCGVPLSENVKFCDVCGEQTGRGRTASGSAEGETVIREAAGCTGSRVGYSDRINDPAFARYVRNTNRWAAIFSVVLALAAVAGFYIAGEMGADDLENPQALLIGIGIGSMFLMVALVSVVGRKRSKTWDGVVVDKKVKKKQRRQGSEEDCYYVDYLEYAVLVQDKSGKKHRLTAEDDDTVYNYYQIGDRVRHHAGLNSYEKYDKSKDRIIFCNACGTLCDINDDNCRRCKCPLLK